eukprot:CAMPEP_0115538074 /NCGR_PEP_ID=MMETSP0271-20121206/88673_1 /TAXON_ID=71861 /ORGANISM="Scrippsiella trochoidea, Strain CCMP3099" /LENGTH=31 /DNA_ID= /DNA_START= /DNA_END= /DNA_ORIENTATION=
MSAFLITALRSAITPCSKRMPLATAELDEQA